MASLQDLVASANGLATGRDSLISLLEIIENPVVDARKLVPIVERDPGLTAGLLKLCNSSIYNFKRRIGSPREALVLVGNLTFARLCFALSLEPVLRRDLPGYEQDLDDLWKHSLITAYGAASLVKAMGQGDLRDRAFTAGLLHDIGKLVLDPELAKRRAGSAGAAVETEPGGSAPTAVALAVEPALVTIELERRLTGYDHAEAGAALLETWQLPEQTVAAVRWHHAPVAAGVHQPLAQAVHVAAKVTGFALGPRSAHDSFDDWVAMSVDTTIVPVETLRRLVAAVAARRRNIITLAAGPIA